MMDRPAWHCEYQMFPRLCVTAEIGWTPQEQREWTDFKGRLDRSHYMRLYQKGIRFRVPFPEVTYQNGGIDRSGSLLWGSDSLHGRW